MKKAGEMAFPRPFSLKGESSLNRNKIIALEAILTSRTLTEAAKKAGLSRKTLYDYINTDSEFSAAYQEMINSELSKLLDDIQEKREKAINITMAILENEESKPIDRLRAAQIILTTSDRVLENMQKSTEAMRTELEAAEDEREHAQIKAEIDELLYGPVSDEELKEAQKELHKKYPHLFP